MSNTSLADLINLVGILTALTLYAMLFVMALRERVSRPADDGRNSAMVPALATASLGLIWNLGALSLLGSGHARTAPAWEQALSAIAYAALGFLPAVFVAAAVRPWGRPRRGSTAWIRIAGYGMAGVAAMLHVLQPALGGSTPSALGLRLMAVVSLGIVPAVLWTAPREQRVRRGLVAATAVLAFAVCALHLAQHLPGADTWSAAFFGHHASLPLVLAILYLDYRFAFVDLFLKRALALMLLAGVVLGLYLGVVGPLSSVGDGHLGRHPAAAGTLLGLWVATAFGFPLLQRLASRFVDTVVLRRPDYARVRADLAEQLEGLASPDEILAAVCTRLAAALNARAVLWTVVEAEAAGPAAPASGGLGILLPTHEPPRFALSVRELAPGKRLLSDDLALLDSVALLAARRLDSLRLARERSERDYREQEIARLASEAELRALRAQLNPHFLFNALNTIGYLMRAAPERAFATLLDLTRLLRAVLKRADGEFVTLAQELALVRAYLAIEAARFEDRLRIVIDVPEPLQAWRVPSLLVQPLVENAIKHGITPRAEGGEVSIVARADESSGELVLHVVDSGVGVSQTRLVAHRRQGLGLSSIERRLAAYYGREASFELASQPGFGTRATLRIPPAASRMAEPVGRTAPGRTQPSERTGALL